MKKGEKIQQGRKLASELFDLKLTALELMPVDEQARWRSRYPGLSQKEFEDIRRQVIQAKVTQQSRVGWQVIPRDLAVIIACLVSYFFNLEAGIMVGAVALIMLEILFRANYSDRLYKILSYLVWFTYPALILLGVAVHRQYTAWWQVGGILAGVWAGSFLLSMLLRVILEGVFRQQKNTPA